LETAVFIKGLIIGFIICAPMGPIGLFCVRKILIDGRFAGFASVLGASTVDALYCAIAGLGVTYISNFITHKQGLIRLAGGLILIAVGIRIFLAKPPEKPLSNGANRRHGVVGDFVGAALLMFTNPLAIIVFSAAFTALGVHGWRGDYNLTAALVSGVFAGSALWAPILVTVVSLFQVRVNGSQLRLISRISGAIIAGFGLAVWVISLLN
jgi:threonine/homoserine/homoserine lactone efflux protein